MYADMETNIKYPTLFLSMWSNNIISDIKLSAILSWSWLTQSTSKIIGRIHIHISLLLEQDLWSLWLFTPCLLSNICLFALITNQMYRFLVNVVFFRDCPKDNNQGQGQYLCPKGNWHLLKLCFSQWKIDTPHHPLFPILNFDLTISYKFVFVHFLSLTLSHNDIYLQICVGIGLLKFPTSLSCNNLGSLLALSFPVDLLSFPFSLM